MLRQDNPLGFSKAILGAHSARSMMFLEMHNLVRALPQDATKDDFPRAIIEENILEKSTLSGRKKSLRHLTELYGLDPSKALFRVFWMLGHADRNSLAQLCLVCAYEGDRHGNLYTGFNTEDTPIQVEATKFSGGIVIAQVNKLVDGDKEKISRVDIPGEWVEGTTLRSVESGREVSATARR